MAKRNVCHCFFYLHRPAGLAWEVRKTSPSKHRSQAADQPPAHRNKEEGGRGSRRAARHLEFGQGKNEEKKGEQCAVGTKAPTWADRVRGVVLRPEASEGRREGDVKGEQVVSDGEGWETVTRGRNKTLPHSNCASRPSPGTWKKEGREERETQPSLPQTINPDLVGLPPIKTTPTATCANNGVEKGEEMEKEENEKSLPTDPGMEKVTFAALCNHIHFSLV